MQKSFFTISELADRWCVSKAHVRRMYLRGSIETMRIGRTVRVPSTEVERIEKNNLFQSPCF